MWARRCAFPCCGLALLLFLAAAGCSQQNRELLASAPSPAGSVLKAVLSPGPSPGVVGEALGALKPPGLSLPGKRKLLADADQQAKAPAYTPKEAPAPSPKIPANAPKPAHSPTAEAPKPAKSPSTGRRRSLLAHSPKSAKSPSASAPSPDSGATAHDYCCAKLLPLNFQSNLPVVIIDTGSTNVTRSKKGPHFDICTCSTGLNKGDVNITAKVRVRGGTDSQLRNTIYQYAVDISHKKSFLGLPKAKEFILYAQTLDPFGLHEWLGFKLASQTGEYAIENQYCELFIKDSVGALNLNDHYRGIYLALQPVKQGKTSVNVAKNNNTADITGGYIAEFQHGQNQHNGNTINGTSPNTTNNQWNVKFPSKKHITPAQLDYFQSYLNKFEGALFGSSFTDPSSGWRQYASESHWINWFLTIELIRNVKAGYHSSAFISKNADASFVMGPVWDNVEGFGTCCGYPVMGYNGSASQNVAVNPASGGNGVSPSGWLFLQCLNDYCPILETYAPGYGISDWFQQLWKDPVWVKNVGSRWTELRQGAWSDASLTSTINSLSTLLGSASTRTLNRWPGTLYYPQYFSTPQAQFQFSIQSLTTWVTTRLQWLDSAVQQAQNPAMAFGPYPGSYNAPAASPSSNAAGSGSVAG